MCPIASVVGMIWHDLARPEEPSQRRSADHIVRRAMSSQQPLVGGNRAALSELARQPQRPLSQQTPGGARYEPREPRSAATVLLRLLSSMTLAAFSVLARVMRDAIGNA